MSPEYNLLMRTLYLAGVYLYMMPLGMGVAKGDSFHGWGFRWSSLWCCYGTAIESFAKLADSIFFKVPKYVPNHLILKIFHVFQQQLYWTLMCYEVLLVFLSLRYGLLLASAFMSETCSWSLSAPDA